MVNLESLLYPQLQSFPADERARVLKSARLMPFDVVELVGIAVGLMLVTAVTRGLLAEVAVMSRVLSLLLNFLIAIPLLALLVGPFWIRRNRRGLEQEWAKRTSS
jgi:hypothetical protein